MPITVTLRSATDTGRLADITRPIRGRCEYVTTCRRCGGAGGWTGWPGYTCFECRGQTVGLYSHADWLFPLEWTDTQITEFRAAKKAAAEARAARKRDALQEAADAARAAQSDEFKAIHARWLAGEFTARADLAVVTDILSRTQILTPITAEDATQVIAAYQTAEQRLAAKTISAWQGTIGTKLSVTGTVTAAKTIESMYGNTRLIVISDGFNTYTTFTTAAWAWSTSTGDMVTVAGTVKAHDTYDGERRTVLTRTKQAATV